jgi:hypothetical protein
LRFRAGELPWRRASSPYCFVGGYRGFGVWVFALTGVLVGAGLGLTVPIDRGWVENGVPTGALTPRGGILWLALGCWFSWFGTFMAISPLKATDATPRELIAQEVSPFFLCAGAVGLTIGGRALSRGLGGRGASRGTVADNGLKRALRDIQGYFQTLPRTLVALLQGRARHRGKSGDQRQDE